MINMDLVEQLLAVKKAEANEQEATQKVLSKAGEIIGSVLNVSSNITVTAPVEIKGKAKKEKMTVEQVQNQILGVIKSNKPIILPKKASSKSSKKATTNTPAKPKATPEEKLAAGLIKLMDTYKEDRPLFSTIDIVDGKQTWSNGHIVIKLKNNISSLDSRKHKPEDKYPDIKKIMVPIQEKATEVLFELPTKDIKEIIKGEKADKMIVMEGVGFGISTLRNLCSLTSNIKFFKGESIFSPMYYDTEMFDGLIMPCRWSGNVETIKEQGIKVWNKAE